MWQMIAGPGLRCAECRHGIQPGRLCLSELPEETPAGVSRMDFKNYCIGCPECWSRGNHACYVRHLDSGRSTGKTPRSLPCARCGRRIGAGEKAGVETYYEWSEALSETDDRKLEASVLGTAVTATGIDMRIRGVPSGSFSNLSDGLQVKFTRAGLGGHLGSRISADAQGFYHESIPYPVRNLGGDAVKRFLESKDASHIQSVHNAPELAHNSSNMIWEDSAINRARGSYDMTGWEQFRANATNAFDVSKIVFRKCLKTAGMTAFFRALLEAPVAAIENYYHYRRGRKTGEEAIREAAVAIGKRAVTGLDIGFAVTAAIVLVPGAGAGAVLVTIAPILFRVGIIVYGYSALKRIQKARAYDLPPQLSRVGTYFCSHRCHTKFAYETGKSALMRWESNRVAIAP